MPQTTAQAERTKAEHVEFVHMLKHANLLYVGTRVLILLDLSYVSRFWCACKTIANQNILMPLLNLLAALV